MIIIKQAFVKLYILLHLFIKIDSLIKESKIAFKNGTNFSSQTVQLFSKKWQKKRWSRTETCIRYRVLHCVFIHDVGGNIAALPMFADPPVKKNSYFPLCNYHQSSNYPFPACDIWQSRAGVV